MKKVNGLKWIFTFLFPYRGILTVGQGTRRSIANACYVVFVAAETLRLGPGGKTTNLLPNRLQANPLAIRVEIKATYFTLYEQNCLFPMMSHMTCRKIGSRKLSRAADWRKKRSQ